jgi:4-hydroxybenzoate polyprenyltransferase
MHPPVAPSTHLPAAATGAPAAEARAVGFVLRRWASWIRLQHWVHFLVLPLAGIDLRAPLATSLFGLVRGICISFLVLSFGYLLNAVTDRTMDLDVDKNPLVADRVANGSFRAPLIAFSIGALLFAATGPLVVLACTATSLLSGVVYSTGPRLKAYPVAGTLMNVTNFAPLLFVGLTASRPAPATALLAVAFSALLLQNQLLHEAADAPEDTRGQVRTTFQAAGPTASAILSALCGVAAGAATWQIAASAGLSWTIALLAAPYALYFPLRMVRQGHRAEGMKAARLLHRLCSAASGALLFAITQGCAI